MTAFRVQITEDSITARLAALLKAGENLTPAMRAISGLLADLTEEAFARQAQPGGPKWAPLARSTIEGRIDRWARKKGGTRKDGRISKTVANRASSARLLQDTGRLAAAVQASSGADFAQIGVSARLSIPQAISIPSCVPTWMRSLRPTTQRYSARRSSSAIPRPIIPPAAGSMLRV